MPLRAEICRHRRLGFASGGFYIQCCECGDMWTATLPHGCEADLKVDPDRPGKSGYLTMHDLRLAPEGAR